MGADRGRQVSESYLTRDSPPCIKWGGNLAAMNQKEPRTAQRRFASSEEGIVKD